jgi:sugar (pentulose or hexulose) kinase
MGLKYICGIDIGTTNIKGAVYSSQGRMISKYSSSYDSYTPEEGHHEQDPDHWFSGVIAVLEKLIADDDIKNNLKAISLSTQGGTIVPVDKDFKPLNRAITWLDRRGENILKESPHFQEKNIEFYKKTGWRLDSGISFLPAVWLKAKRKEIFDKTYKLLFVNDYVLKKLCGSNVQDPSNASLTLFYNVKEGRWDPELFKLAGFSEDSFSEVKDSGAVIGYLDKKILKEMGINTEIMLINGGHDQYCAGIGAGIFDEEEILIATGTAWVIFKMLDDCLFDTERFFSIGRNIIKDKFGFIYTIPTAGASLNWLARKIMNLEDERQLFEIIDKDHKIIAGIRNDIIYHPYLTGNFGPDFDINKRADFSAIGINHDFRDIIKAIMEGVGFQLRKILDVMKESGIEVNNIKMSGGGARSKIWQKIIADITGLKILIPQDLQEDLAVKGAAIIAGWGSGIFGSLKEGFNKLDSKFCPVYPEKENIEFYNNKFMSF